MARKQPPETELGMQMTPLIDVVFQLIIFFMLVIDLTQQELEDIKLPMASEASEDKNPEQGRMIINISKDGKFIRKRKELTLDQVQTELVLFANKFKRDKQGLSEKPILVRADEITRFDAVQKVMQLCGKDGIKIWKVELAAAETGEQDDQGSGGGP